MKKLYLAFTVDEWFMRQVERRLATATLPFRSDVTRKPDNQEHVTLLYLDRVEAGNEGTVASLLDDTFGGKAPHAAFTFDEWTVFQGRSVPTVGYLAAAGTPDGANNWPMLRHALRQLLKPFAPREDHDAWHPHVSVGTLPMALVAPDFRAPILPPVRCEASGLILYAKNQGRREILATFPR